MSNTVYIINPTLPQNIPIVTALANAVHGSKPGKLEAYEIYSLPSQSGKKVFYALTLPVLQFKADPFAQSAAPPIRLDIYEPTAENHGDCGNIYPVIESIISHKDLAVFDTPGSYVIKETLTNHNAPSDKLNKPNWFVRVANREQYLGSHHPTLGIHYQLVARDNVSFLHMNRAPGFPLNFYKNKLSGEQFLSLACTLLEEVPKQIHQIVTSGKYKGRVIVHCDLKLENIMAAWKDNKWTVTVIDMGLAKAIEQGRPYSTSHHHGNSLVWDSKMMFATMMQKSKSYDIQSDLYALFISITELAGALSRDRLNTTQEILEEVEKPNLTGIFSNMHFDPITQDQLTKVLLHSLSAKKKDRPAREAVLAVFQEALTMVQQNKTKIDLVTEHAENIKVTAADLKACVEQPLDDIVREHKRNGQSRKVTLKSWLKQFRQLRYLASEEENEQFDTLFNNNIDLQIKSFYIFNFLRFNLINEYNDEACVRLLLRHEKLTASLRTELTLPEHWKNLFQLLVHSLPLQLTTGQAAECNELGLFKKNISVFLLQKIPTDAPLLVLQMSKGLEKQLQLKFYDWLDQLPAFAKLFNKRYQCIDQLKELHKKMPPLFSLQEDLQEQFVDWGLEIFDKTAQGKFIENPKLYFGRYFFMVELLNRYISRYEQLSNLPNIFPALGQSTLSVYSIDEALQNFQFGDEQAVTDLSQKLELLLILNSAYAYLEAQDYLQYDFIVNEYEAKLKMFINRFVNSQCQQKQEFKAELEAMCDHFEAINELDAFTTMCFQFPHIQQSMNVLLKNNFKIMKVAESLHNEIGNDSLRRLNRGMGILLSQETDPSILNEKLYIEFTRYFALPYKYAPPVPKVHTHDNLNTTFKVSAASAKEETTRMMIKLHTP